MSILITGATGYIGTHLTQKLVQEGNAVRMLSRNPPSFHHPLIEVVEGDILDKRSLQKAMKNISQVYHLAAYARLWAKDPQIFYQINVDGTQNVVDAVKLAGVKKILHTSTAGVLGPSDHTPIHEEHKRSIPFFNVYEETKAIAEDIIRSFVQQGGQATIVNPARIYGPGLDSVSNPVTKIIELYLKGKWHIIPGSGNDLGSYGYIEDVVYGHIQAMEKGRNGERYILAGVNLRFNELIAWIKEISGIERRLYRIPFSVLKAVSKVMTLRASLIGSPPMITPEWVQRYKYDWALDSQKAVQDLGYTIRPIKEGLQKTIEWLRKNRM